MSASPDNIQQQQTLLATHRRTLATLLVQQAAHGSAFAPTLSPLCYNIPIPACPA